MDESGGTKPAMAGVEQVGDQDKNASEEEAPKKSPTDMDIELTSASLGEEVETDPETQKQLASLWTDSPQEQPEAAAGEKKAGIKKLGGQPRVASTSRPVTTDDISGIWSDAPDVSEVFRS